MQNKQKYEAKQDIFAAVIFYHALYICSIYIYTHTCTHSYDVFMCTLHCGVCGSYRYIYMTVTGTTKLLHASIWTTLLLAKSAKQKKQRTQLQSQAYCAPHCYAQTATATETQLLTACLGICACHCSHFGDSAVDLSNHANTWWHGTTIKMLKESTYCCIYRDLLFEICFIIDIFTEE